MVNDKAAGLIRAAQEGVQFLKESLDGIEKVYESELQEARDRHAEIVSQLQSPHRSQSDDAVPEERPPEEIPAPTRPDFTNRLSICTDPSIFSQCESSMTTAKGYGSIDLGSVSSMDEGFLSKAVSADHEDSIPTECDPIDSGPDALRRTMKKLDARRANPEARSGLLGGDEDRSAALHNFTIDILGVDDEESGLDASHDQSAQDSFTCVDLHPIWKEKGRSYRRNAVKHGTTCAFNWSNTRSTTSIGSFINQIASLRTVKDACCCRLPGMQKALVSHPNGKKRLLWDSFGMFLIFYDLVTVPMMPFEPAKTDFTIIMSWIATVYWTIDIPCSFFVGFHKKGVLEMRLRAIARRYARTWLAFDIIVVTIDWVVTLLTQITEDSADRGDNVGAMGRLGRLGRFLRACRLLRLLKLRGMISEIFDRIHNEAAQIISRICGLIIFIIIVNHLLACGFYGIAWWNPGKGDTWIIANDLEGEPFPYRYFTSLHWSLTQFTPASMEIFPRNTAERIYNVLTLLFAMVTFSSFVGSITNAMTRLRNLDSEELEKSSQLKKYLNENKISEDLSNQIWSWITDSKDLGTARLHEPTVKAIAGLPRRLRSGLHEEIYGKALNKHPFFKMFSSVHAVAMPKLYACLKESAVNLGLELFASDDNAKHMYFLLSGSMVYHRQWHINGFRASATVATQSAENKKVGYRASAQTLRSLASNGMDDGDCIVSGGQWVCEQVLWIRWQHCGILLARTHVELFAIDAIVFQELCQRELADTWQPARYARLFARYITQDRVELTDVWCDFAIIQSLTISAFCDPPTPILASPCSTPGVAPSSPTRMGSFRSARSSTLEAKKTTHSLGTTYLGTPLGSSPKKVSISLGSESEIPLFNSQRASIESVLVAKKSPSSSSRDSTSPQTSKFRGSNLENASHLQRLVATSESD